MPTASNTMPCLWQFGYMVPQRRGEKYQTVRNSEKTSSCNEGYKKLYEASFKVQLCSKALFKKLFPKKSNKIRYKSAVIQTANMLRKHARKASWAVKQANMTMMEELREAKVSCLLYTSPSPRDMRRSRMPSSA